MLFHSMNVLSPLSLTQRLHSIYIVGWLKDFIVSQ